VVALPRLWRTSAGRSEEDVEQHRQHDRQHDGSEDHDQTARRSTERPDLVVADAHPLVIPRCGRTVRRRWPLTFRIVGGGLSRLSALSSEHETAGSDERSYHLLGDSGLDR